MSSYWGLNSSKVINPNYTAASSSPFAPTASRPQPSTSNSVSASIDALFAVMQRLEARLDANEPRPLPTRSPRPDPDPPYNMPWDGQSPSWMPTGIPTPSTAAAIPSLSLSTMVPQIPQYVDSYWQPPIMDGNQVAYGGQQLGTTRMTTEMVPSSWDPPATRMETRGPSSPSSPYEFDPILGRPRTSWDLPRPRIAPESCSNPSDWNYSDPYAYDSPFGRPLTSWDLPRPRIESYGGGGSSQYEYGASGNHGGGSYSPYSNYGGGYSGGRYVNEPNPYVSPPPPPREGNYVLAPQPNPPSYTHPQQSWGLPWSRTAPDSLHIISDYDLSSTHAHGTIVATEEKGVNLEACAEAGIVDGVVAPVADESVGNEEGDALNPAMDEVGEEKSDLVVDDSEVGVAGKLADENMSKTKPIGGQWGNNGFCPQKLSRDSRGLLLSPLPSSAKIRKGGVADFAYEKRARSNRHEAGGNTSRVPFTQPRRSWHNEDQRIVGFAENGNGSSCRKLSFGSRCLVIFGIYALEEVYKDLLYLHLEDKVIFKGGGS